MDEPAAAALVLTPSDLATIAKVNEGRRSAGLPPVDGEVGDRWIAEHAAKVKAESAPQIAEVAKAEQGSAPPEEPASP